MQYVRYLLFALLFPGFMYAQFTLQDYKTFLQQHQDMSYQQLAQMHNTGVFRGPLNLTPENYLYFDTITTKFTLTPYEQQLLRQNGFMATERITWQQFGAAYTDIFFKDLPVFVSTDAILHSLHMSYDMILMQLEYSYLIPKLKALLQQAHAAMGTLEGQYGSVPAMRQSLLDADLYLTVPQKLLGLGAAPFYPQNTGRVDTLMQWISAELPVQTSLFGEPRHYVDFSQFKVRGHYADPFNLQMFPGLDKYFKAMIWLGRTEVNLLNPGFGRLRHSAESMRSTIGAALIAQAVTTTPNALLYTLQIDSLISFFVGEQDNVTLQNMNSLLLRAGISNVQQLTDTTNLFRLQDTLLNSPFAYQLINSQMLVGNPFSPDSITPASAFMLMGQRFIMDSYVTAQVVYDRVTYQGWKVKRMLPNTLDVLFALGNDAAHQLLKPELEAYNYSTNLAVVRYLIDGYGNDFWDKNLFHTWLNGLRKMNPPANRAGLPAFMQTGAWWQQKMNTQLASWTQLRHDNLLYAKQSYSGIVVCSFPYGYVEPFPEVYTTVGGFAQKLRTIVEGLDAPNLPNKFFIINWSNNVKKTTDTLASIAQKELLGMQLTPQERDFLKSMIKRIQDPYDAPIKGWYYELFYQGSAFTKQDYIVADIHTAGSDSSGQMVGWVKHVGTGPVNLGVVTVEYPAGTFVTYAGAFNSYYDYTSTNFLRLTDEQWKNTYLATAARPDWVNAYLANAQGNPRGSGPVLLTDIKAPLPESIPEDAWLAQNYPNPFNGGTVISFRVPATRSGQQVTLAVYDSRGAKIATLLNEPLQAGNYATQWNAKTASGKPAPSGIYFYRLSAGSQTLNGKMILLK